MSYENITQAKTKNIKRPLSEPESEHETNENFYQFIVLESIEETPITKLFPFLIQKSIETHCKPINIKKLWTTPLLYKQQIKNNQKKILKWKQCGKLNIKTYPHPTLNLSKGVIKSPDLTSYSLKEIKLHLKPQGITDVRRISILKETRTIDTNTCILTFDKPTIPTSIRISYINMKIKTNIPNPLRCQKRQKYEHPRDKCTRPPICAKCGKSNHIHLESKIPSTASTALENTLCIYGNVKSGKKNYWNKIHKKYLIPRGQKNRTNIRTTQLYICSKKKKKGNEEKEYTKPKQEEWIKKSNRNTKNDHKRDNHGTYECETHNQTQEKNLSKEKKKSKLIINEPIPLSKRFSPMDTEDPVETTKEGSDKITTHIKTDTINLQKRLNKK